MTKRTLYLNCIKNNCDPRKNGRGIIRDINRVMSDISRTRYNRVGIGKKEGKGLEDWVSSFNKYTSSKERNMIVIVCRKVLQMLSAYLRNPESVAQQHILGNYQAN